MKSSKGWERELRQSSSCSRWACHEAGCFAGATWRHGKEGYGTEWYCDEHFAKNVYGKFEFLVSEARKRCKTVT